MDSKEYAKSKDALTLCKIMRGSELEYLKCGEAEEGNSHRPVLVVNDTNRFTS